MKKKLLGLCILLMAAMFILVNPGKVQAATTWKTVYAEEKNDKEDRMVGKVEFLAKWTYKKGYTLYVVTSKTKKKVATEIDDPSVITNGKTFYYAKSGYLYKSTVSKPGSSSKIATLKKGKKGVWALGEYYDGKIYFTRGSQNGDFCSVDVKTGKVKLLVKNASVLSLVEDGVYMLMSSMDGETPAKLTMYNVASGKTTVISEAALDFFYDALYTYYPEERYIYYAKVVKTGRPSSVEIWRYSTLNGEHTKVQKAFKCYGFLYMTYEKAVYYSNKAQTKETVKYYPDYQ